MPNPTNDRGLKHYDLVRLINEPLSKETTSRIIGKIVDVVSDDTTFRAFGPSWEFGRNYLMKQLLTKFVSEDTDSSDIRRDRAIVKWLGVERRNRRTNERIWGQETVINGLGPTTKILMKAAELVEKIIGSVPPLDLLSYGSFSGGATTSLKRGVGTLQSKFTGIRDATPACFELFRTLNFEVWHLLAPEVLNPRLVKGNVLFTVPKTAVIDRVAAKEPDLNIFCQKAVGDYFRRQLRSCARVDLNDQTVNQRLAWEGSRYGTLATIDLSSASDSLTCALVHMLLPPKWTSLLESLRSPKTFIDGASHSNEMFSSMGNGFTFELESLVFWALAKASCYLSGTKGRVNVYGDDIIVPTSVVPMLIPLLNWCGFVVNVDKTFSSGPFRESCGKHYHDGLDVSPFFIRSPFKKVTDVIHTLNQFKAWILRLHGDMVLDTQRDLTRVWRELAQEFVPKQLWGGYDLESRTQLVAPGVRSLELLEVTRRHPAQEVALQRAAYLSTLCRMGLSSYAESRDSLPFSLCSPTGKWSVRRVRPSPAVFGVTRPTFFNEGGSS